MLSFLSRKKAVSVYSPVSGMIIPLNTVKDNIFSSKMLGETIAFSINHHKITAPCDGIITMVFPALHAFAVKADNGLELMVHIGIETVNLNGQGFIQKAFQGEKVKHGDVVIEVDLDYMHEKHIDMTTLLIVTNSDQYSIYLEGDKEVQSGKDIVMVCERS